MSLLSSLLISSGIWRAVLFTPGGDLPFQLKIEQNKNVPTFTIINGNENMLLDDVTVKGDSIIVRFPVYESELRLKATSKNHLEGAFINLTRSTHASIRMEANLSSEPRFSVKSASAPAALAGRWSVTFAPGTADSSEAIGVFEQNKNHVTGTFLTTSGDYRFLEGVVDGDSLFLSTFDGVFVYLFKGAIKGDHINGMFYSGTHRQTPWVGTKNEKASLPDANSLTTIKDGEKGFYFAFPDLDSMMVSINDSAFAGKVVIVQILGSWCPNCLDETAYLTDYYDKNKNRGIEIIGLSFEKTDDFKRASENVKRLRKRLKINYTLLIASNRDKLKVT
ncbi:MAG TPA: TlpA disulfide reductase family protein, partial [Bacteroidia bacterium]|nr:TlpA disulfide reductase family protein [Bacteroidia bacterium]